MNGKHWTDEELIARIYAVAEADEAHLAGCRECSERLLALESHRAAVLEPAVVSEDRLRAQRQAVWARLEQPQRGWLWKLAPAGAMALMLVAGVALHSPAPKPAPVQVAMSDSQFFSEVATVVNEESPRAAETMQGLFAEGTQTEAQ